MNIDFLELLNDYDKNFCRNKCYILTNYSEKPFEIIFNISDLHHLFGIHKISDIKSMNWIAKVRSNNFSLETYSKKDLINIIPRIESYYFLREIFIENKVNTLILEKDINKNTMKLSLVFSANNSKQKYVVLGLRKDKRGYYRPVTLHVSRVDKYRSCRKTKIINIEWI